MRAIIECRCNKEITDEELKKILYKNDWWPVLPQEDELVVNHYNEILEHVSEQDKAWVGRTYRFTIYDEISKSWGIVNRPSTYCITFRIKNPNSDKLKQACEKLIADLVRETNGVESIDIKQPAPRLYSLIAPIIPNWSQKSQDKMFSFPTRIEVLEPNSSLHAFSGDVKIGNKFRVLISVKKTDFIVAVVAALVSLFLLFITWPSIQPALFSAFTSDEKMLEWIDGFLQRLATSTIFTTFVTSLNLLLYYREIRPKAYIHWTI